MEYHSILTRRFCLISFFAIKFLGLALGGCGKPNCPEIPQDNNWDSSQACLSRLRQYGDRVVVYPKERCPWKHLVDLGIFEGFSPGMTIDDAERLVRMPSRVGENDLGRFIEFDTQLGTVRVAREDHGSTFLPIDKIWVLRGFPKNRSPNSVLSDEIVSQLPVNAHRLEVAVMNNCDYPALKVYIVAGQIEGITWIDNPGSKLH